MIDGTEAVAYNINNRVADTHEACRQTKRSLTRLLSFCIQKDLSWRKRDLLSLLPTTYDRSHELVKCVFTPKTSFDDSHKLIIPHAKAHRQEN
jgi:hypothetical protein